MYLKLNNARNIFSQEFLPVLTLFTMSAKTALVVENKKVNYIGMHD